LMGEGKGKNKKQAEQAAARIALSELKKKLASSGQTP
ncbi:MAG: hypothetical protein GWO07_09935, partial [Candidatus Dadabacteria bacterium]|nr:hypothetical protein [Candidatus Dadabacteria bacterium]NIU00750.1 hypothetical protein [Nitrosopumilaceae archaeon]NIU87180.1 hypothetical protein [Nitrosopumilaceae archaeon]NIX15649.1 hypothetical protein [Candidatus Dadabacteria bacterium]NIX61352.1 hypothetical protein [Nitrosopumilaceae archaeon]